MIRKLKFKRLLLLTLEALKYIVFAVILYLGFLQVNELIQLIRLEEQEILAHLKVIYLLIATLLMPINWILETFKWQVLTSDVISNNHRSVSREVLSGISVSIVTPNRVGEYFGRVAHFTPHHHISVLSLNFLGSLSQFTITVLAGVVGFLLIYDDLLNPLIGNYSVGYVVLVPLLLAILAGVFYFKINWLVRIVAWLVPLRWGQLILNKLQLARQMSCRKRLLVLFISFIRYMVYLIQFVLLLYAFNVSVSVLDAMAGVALIYLLQTGVPLPSILSLVVRSSVALYIYEQMGSGGSGVLIASYLLWLINLGVPAIIGGIFFIQLNWRKTLGYEE